MDGYPAMDSARHPFSRSHQPIPAGAEDDPTLSVFYEEQIMKLLENAAGSPDGGARRASVLSRVTGGMHSKKSSFILHPGFSGTIMRERSSLRAPSMDFGDD